MSQDRAELFSYYLRILAPDLPVPEREYSFARPRRWRFDYFWPDRNVAVEVDGNAWSTRGGGRHGQDSDRWKMSHAAAMGIRVFRFSPQMLEDEPDKCIALVRRAMEAV